MLDGETVATETAAAVTTVRFGTPTEASSRTTSPPVSHSGWPVRSPSTAWAGWFIDGVDGDRSNVVGLGLY